MTEPTLLVMAAGMGSRYGGLKQLDAVGPDGETLMDYSLFDAKRAGFGRVVFIIRRDFETLFHEKVSARVSSILPVACAFQDFNDLPQGSAGNPTRSKPWGTGHAVWCARNTVHEPFVVINGDDFYGRDSFATAARFLNERTGLKNEYSLIAYALRNTLSPHGAVSRGLCELDQAGELARITETHGIVTDGTNARYPDPRNAGEFLLASGSTHASMNLWAFTPDFFPQLEARLKEFLAENCSSEKAEFYLPEAVSQLVRLQQARVRVLQTRASWFGITYREDKPRVEKQLRHLIAENEYPASLWNTQTVAH